MLMTSVVFIALTPGYKTTRVFDFNHVMSVISADQCNVRGEGSVMVLKVGTENIVHVRVYVKEKCFMRVI